MSVTERIVDEDGMIWVPAVQYMLPDGHQVHTEVRIFAKHETAFEELAARGCRLTGEILTTGEVSVAVEHEAGDFDVKVCSNGPEVRDAMSAMLEAWNTKAFEEWLAEATEEVRSS